MESLLKEFNKKHIENLDKLSLLNKSRASFSAPAGIRKSGAKGSSQEFSDFREYMPGDDIRRVDWNSFARFDKLFVKVFAEEKQASVHIFVDTSASMVENYSIGFEKELSKDRMQGMLAASISYIALKNTDRVNLFAFDDGIAAKRVRLSSMPMFSQALSFLDGLHFGGQSSICSALAQAVPHMGMRGITYIFSDFYFEDGWQEAVSLLRYQKQDCVFVKLVFEEEENPSFTGSIRLIDSETNAQREVEMTAGIIKQYKKIYMEEENKLKEYCLRHGIAFRKLIINKISILDALFSIL